MLRKIFSQLKQQCFKMLQFFFQKEWHTPSFHAQKGLQKKTNKNGIWKRKLVQKLFTPECKI